MSTRDIEAHLLEIYGIHASRELISNITDVVVEEIKEWQSRPVDELYPIVYVDGIRIKAKDAVIDEGPGTSGTGRGTHPPVRRIR